MNGTILHPKIFFLQIPKPANDLVLNLLHQKSKLLKNNNCAVLSKPQLDFLYTVIIKVLTFDVTCTIFGQMSEVAIAKYSHSRHPC